MNCNLFVFYFIVAVQYVLSRLGNVQIFYENHTFSKKFVNHSGKVRWVCSAYHSRGCPASLYTVDDRIIRRSGRHKHENVKI